MGKQERDLVKLQLMLTNSYGGDKLAVVRWLKGGAKKDDCMNIRACLE